VAELQKADYELFASRSEREEDQANLLKIESKLAELEHVAADVGERLARLKPRWMPFEWRSRWP